MRDRRPFVVPILTRARRSPPLHFGSYRRFRGPEDPLPLVGRARAAPLLVEPGHTLGPWLAVAAPTLNLRGGPGTSCDVVGRLAAGSLVEVRGVVGERSSPAVRLALLFGSRGSGGAREESDIDLALLCDTPISSADRFALIVSDRYTTGC